MAKNPQGTAKKSVGKQANVIKPVALVPPVVVRVKGHPLVDDLSAGKLARRMRPGDKVALLRGVSPQLLMTGLRDYAYLSARRPWIAYVARVAVVHASLRTNPNDFLLSASDGNYHEPFAGVYFHAAKANVPVLVDFQVNALVPQTVSTQTGAQLQSTTLSAGFHHVAIIVVPETADLHHAQLRTQKGNPKQALLELERVELTTLK